VFGRKNEKDIVYRRKSQQWVCVRVRVRVGVSVCVCVCIE
jgi:hypothetical protein